MSFLNRINPARSLFFRFFLWFWLMAIVIFFSSMWVLKQLGSDTQYLPIKAEQLRELSRVTTKLQKQIDKKGSRFELKKSLAQMARNQRIRIVLLDPLTGKLVLNNMLHIDDEVFENFNIESPPVFIASRGLVLIGPSLISMQSKSYQLFVVHPRPRGFIRDVRQNNPGVMLLFVMLLSGLLCYLFVRSLLLPIQQLRLASKQMATGDLKARVGSASHRTDEIGQLGRDFNHMSEQVEHLLSSHKRLLGDISHELRSPLARLQLSIGIAQQQGDLDSSSMQAALARIEKESLQIEQMIAQVLMLSRFDSEITTPNMQDVTLEEVMAPIIADAEFESEQQNKTLNYQFEDNFSFKADFQLLSSAIENILRNAIGYAEHCIEIDVSKVRDRIIWTIDDDGSGVDEALLTHIFQPFFRDSTARDRKSGGVGLGLAIAQRAIAKHKGHVEAVNLPNGGLSIAISIPSH